MNSPEKYNCVIVKMDPHSKVLAISYQDYRMITARLDAGAIVVGVKNEPKGRDDVVGKVLPAQT